MRGSAEVVHHTTLDLDVQLSTFRALNENLSRLRGVGATNTAGLVVDLATGDVLASVGSADYFDLDAHGAIDFLETRRSPGSALKPFIYGLALEKGTHTAATVIADTPVEFEVPGGGLYVPENITHTFLGPHVAARGAGQLAQHPRAAGCWRRSASTRPSSASSAAACRACASRPRRTAWGWRSARCR